MLDKLEKNGKLHMVEQDTFKKPTKGVSFAADDSQVSSSSQSLISEREDDE